MNPSNEKYSMEEMIELVNNIQNKFQSFVHLQKNLIDYINQITSTHQQIIQDLSFIKLIFNEQFLSERKNDQLFDEELKMKSSLTEMDEYISSTSPLSFQSSSTNSLNNSQRISSSNLKKSDHSSKTRIKSPKSVSFSFDQNLSSNSNQQTIHHPNSSMKKDLFPNLFQEHHQQLSQQTNIGYQLGNALTNVRIHEIEQINGEYLRLLNISNSDDYDLSQHYLQQNISCIPFSRFRFPLNTILRAGQTITIWCGSFKEIESNPPHTFIWKEQRKWETGPECVTILAKPTGQAIAWARSSNRLNSDQSSSDILFVHSKCHQSGSEVSISSSLNRKSVNQFIGNHKSAFGPSPCQNIGTQLLNRPKSSPYSNHIGCKKDVLTRSSLMNT